MKHYTLYIYIIIIWFVWGCKTTKKDYQQTEVLHMDSVSIDSMVRWGWSSEEVLTLDSFLRSLSATITEYDTERTDTNGAHPIKRVSVISQSTTGGRKQVGKKEAITEEAASHEEHKAVVDSTEVSKSVRSSRGGKAVKLSFLCGVIIALILVYLIKKARQKFG